MKKNKIYLLLFFLAATALIAACKKTDYSFGKIKTPANLVITTTVAGATAANPTGDGSGNITVSVTADNALNYKIYFGNGDSVLTSSGKASYQYTTLDTNQYTITVNAIGTGGATSTLSKQVRILYQYQIPANIVSLMTGGSSKNWVIAKDTVGHFGVGPVSSFAPDWYKAGPNEKKPCAYGGVVTFSQVGSAGMSMIDNNNGNTFIIGAATSFYGVTGGDGCYGINTGGTKTLGFSVAKSGSGPANSTGIQFNVPGNGIVGFGTGGSTYEIISLSSTVIVLRNIGSDGNAWYQILRSNTSSLK